MKINMGITMEKKLSVLAKKYAALDDRSFSNYVERAVARQVEEDQQREGSAAETKAAPAPKAAGKAKAAPASKKTARR